MTTEVQSASDAGSIQSPVFRALRFAGEEVQFGLVLAAICSQAEVAAALADAVIARAESGNATALRRVRRPHDNVTCLGEQQLQARVTRRLSRARAADVGRIDLRFQASKSWKLAVELKLNSQFGSTQLQGYSDWGPVAAIVRDPSKVAPMKDNPSWVGAASWNSLVADLHSLPVDPRWRADWHGLLDIMEVDGDFDVGVPSSRQQQAQVELLESVTQALVDHLAAELTRVYKVKATAAVSGLKSSAVRGGGPAGPAWASPRGTDPGSGSRSATSGVRRRGYASITTPSPIGARSADWSKRTLGSRRSDSNAAMTDFAWSS